MTTLPYFDTEALMAALDVQRDSRGLGWNGLADALWDQSAVPWWTWVTCRYATRGPKVACSST